MLMNMKEILKVANENYFAVPAFNISDYSMFEAVMKTVEDTNSPVIIEVHPVELKFMGTDLMVAIRHRACISPVPVCIHLDHCNDYGTFVRAIQCGFTSVMFDGSALPFEENIEGTKKIIALAHPADVSVEAELGTIGSTGSSAEGGADQIIYTNPEDARYFVEKTGADTLAVAIGTSHGLYPKGMVPKLRHDILKEIKKVVSIPLVLHGGSGNSDEEVAEAVRLGINKVNIASDIKNTYFKKMREVLADPDILDTCDVEPPCQEALAQTVLHKMEIFQTTGKAALYK